MIHFRNQNILMSDLKYPQCFWLISDMITGYQSVESELCIIFNQKSSYYCLTQPFPNHYVSELAVLFQ